MDVILVLVSYLAYIGFLGAAIFCVFNVLRSHRKAAGLKVINYHQAKLAMLRIGFKAKIKRKAQQFRVSFRKSIPKGEVADLALDEMVTIKFETGEEFQRYFDICKKVNQFLAAENTDFDPSIGVDTKVTNQAQKDFMSTDLINELAIIRIIKEMTEVSEDLNKKIATYNYLNQTKQIPQINILQFASLIEVNRVFHEHDGLSVATEKDEVLTKTA
ncbi:MAG: hypothetical protein WA160_09390 [Pseudobdellovibrio sp.]